MTDSADYARRMFLFINKAWGYGDAKPDHTFLALNYRISELQGAVALAQLAKLDLVSRTEFDVQAALLARTQVALAAMEQRLKDLEVKITPP